MAEHERVAQRLAIQIFFADPHGGIAGEVQRKPMGALLRRPPLQQFAQTCVASGGCPSRPARGVC